MLTEIESNLSKKKLNKTQIIVTNFLVAVLPIETM